MLPKKIIFKKNSVLNRFRYIPYGVSCIVLGREEIRKEAHVNCVEGTRDGDNHKRGHR